jgi:cysteine synthase A
MRNAAVDSDLLQAFGSQVKAKVPHLGEGSRVVNPTPLVDVTEALAECASKEYGVRIDPRRFKVYGKFDSGILGGSVKVRPAVRIIEDAIASGKLSRGQTVFEATSGNFGLALGLFGDLGFDSVALVSRRLQDGVIQKLRNDGVRLINLDIDICPAPGFQGDTDNAVAKGVAVSVRQQLADLGFDTKPFDTGIGEAEALLAKQDAIGLAKFLARTYGGYCPEQYDNELNVVVHEEVTGPELDQQLGELGGSLADFVVVCAFGTGGTSTGLSRYAAEKYGRKAVRVVFPPAGEDVAGIRTREKADGLRFYKPEEYLGVHDVGFEEARKLMAFFNSKGYDVGESGALVLYSCVQMANYGLESKLVAVVADGADKYAGAPKPKRDQVTLAEAASGIRGYGGVIWAHNMFVPKEEGIRVLASALGCGETEIRVAASGDVQAVLNGRDPSAAFEGLLPKDDRPVLFVCMAGVTSLMLAKVLERRGVRAESLIGGITGIPASKSRQPFELVEMARA